MERTQVLELIDTLKLYGDVGGGLNKGEAVQAEARRLFHERGEIHDQSFARSVGLIPTTRTTF
ncbi:hypothetical protein EOA13_27620, partial [Mesorhizobium sp. M7A.F.Ca.US.011.01.1.1]|uniref:hypothetical protein n=1 Tax=Mesorhizobium sp. M7A.F.Ca.US.011.01.1.1 TaxID=2496741 RepID=UPI000FD22D5B